MKAKFFVILVFFPFGKFLFAQNLISNGGFENYSACPGSLNGYIVSLASPWQILNPNAAPAIFNVCSSPSLVGVPINGGNMDGYQYPRNGNGYAGFVVHSFGGPNNREYFRYPLSESLVQGKVYCLTFYVNLFNDSYDAVDAIGAYFSDTALTCSGLFCLLNYPTQVSNPAGNILSDTLGWMQISGCFTANGNEHFLQIGNFKTDAQTQTTIIPGGFSASYYYLDDVSLYEDTSLNIQETQADKSFSTYPNPANKEVLVNSEKEMDELLLMDLSGDVVLKKQHSKSMDVGDLADGLYLLRCRFNGGDVGFQKLLVLHDR